MQQQSQAGGPGSIGLRRLLRASAFNCGALTKGPEGKTRRHCAWHFGVVWSAVLPLRHVIVQKPQTPIAIALGVRFYPARPYNLNEQHALTVPRRRLILYPLNHFSIYMKQDSLFFNTGNLNLPLPRPSGPRQGLGLGPLPCVRIQGFNSSGLGFSFERLFPP